MVTTWWPSAPGAHAPVLLQDSGEDAGRPRSRRVLLPAAHGMSAGFADRHEGIDLCWMRLPRAATGPQAYGAGATRLARAAPRAITIPNRKMWEPNSPTTLWNEGRWKGTRDSGMITKCMTR